MLFVFPLGSCLRSSIAVPLVLLEVFNGAFPRALLEVCSGSLSEGLA